MTATAQAIKAPCTRCEARTRVPHITRMEPGRTGYDRIAGDTYRTAQGRVFIGGPGWLEALYCQDCSLSLRICRVCGCTDEVGCAEGCSWIEEDLCSACLGRTAAGDDR